jgi:hypothetical protein
MKFKRVCYVVAEGSLLCGRRVSQITLDQDFEAIVAGECDVALMSVTVGGAGVNCQTMNRIVFMEPPTTDTTRKQAKGYNWGLLG